eukprot:3568411-Amphidinium_carterae.1
MRTWSYVLELHLGKGPTRKQPSNDKRMLKHANKRMITSTLSSSARSRPFNLSPSASASNTFRPQRMQRQSENADAEGL